jgi:hypothetical protein
MQIKQFTNMTKDNLNSKKVRKILKIFKIQI